MHCTTSPAEFQPLTLETIALMDAPFLTPEEASDVLGCQAHLIRKVATTIEGRQGMGFPVVRMGTHTKIPRIPFLRFMGWEGTIIGSREGIKA